MTTEQIVLLAIIQGITEFLPISSSAHLVLVPLLSDLPDQGLVFDVALHLGTLAAVMLYFRKQTGMLFTGALGVFKGRFGKDDTQLFGLLVMATIPVAVVGFFFADYIAQSARSFKVIGVTSIIFGVLLWLSDLMPRWHHGLKTLGTGHALVFGLFQALAVIPGTSRSGITMTAGRFMGFKRRDAAAFSMLMAIPVLVLSGGYSIASGFGEAINWQTALPHLLFGAGIAFITAFLAIAALMNIISRLGFGVFAFYRVALGVALLVVGI